MKASFFFPPEFKQKLEVIFRCNHVLTFISISPKLASMVSEFIFWVLQSFWRLFSGFSLNTEHQWEQVFWSNESKFYIFEVGQRYSSECLQTFLKHAGGSVVACGCISGCSIGSGRKTHSILMHHGTQSRKNLNSNRLIFHHDNDPTHTTNAVKGYLDRKNTQWNTISHQLASPESKSKH